MESKIIEILNTEGMDLLSKLKELRVMHRDLDAMIDQLADDMAMDQIKLKRLKKRKLQLKDAIARLESEIIPDLNA